MATSPQHTARGKLLILSLYLPCLTVFAQNGTFEHDQNSTAVSTPDGATLSNYPSATETQFNLEPTRTLSNEQQGSSVDTLGHSSQTIISSVDSSKAISVQPKLSVSVSSKSVENAPSLKLESSLYHPASLASYRVTPELSSHSRSSDQIHRSSSNLDHSSDLTIMYPKLTDTMESSSLKSEILITEIRSVMETSSVYSNHYPQSGSEVTPSKVLYNTDSSKSEYSIDSSSLGLFMPAEILTTPSTSAKQIMSQSEAMYTQSQYIHPSTSDKYTPFMTDSTFDSSATLSKQSFLNLPSASQHLNYSEMEISSADSSTSYLYTSTSSYLYSSSSSYLYSSNSPYLRGSSSPYLDSSASDTYIRFISEYDTFSGLSEQSSLPTSGIFPQWSMNVSDTLIETTVSLETAIELSTTDQVESTYSPSLSYQPIIGTQSMGYNETSEDTSTILTSIYLDESADISSTSYYESVELQSVMHNESSLSFTTPYGLSSTAPNTSYEGSRIFPSTPYEWTTTRRPDTPVYTAKLPSEWYSTDDMAISETPFYPYIAESTERWPVPEQTSSDSQRWPDYQTDIVELHSTTTWLDSEQTAKPTSSAPELMPTPSSSLETKPSATVETTSQITVTTPMKYINQKFIVTFNGDCEPLVTDQEKSSEFQEKVEIVIVEFLEISTNDVLMDRLVCGSVKSHVVIFNATQNYSSHISELVSSGDFLIDIDFPESNNSELYRAYKVEEASLIDPRIKDSGKTDQRKLSDQDIALIILACCICVIIVIIVIVVCARRMYSRKYAQSFNLMDTPHAHLKMEDFTLTQFPRQRRSYDGEGVQVQSYSHYQPNGQPLLTSGHPNHVHNQSADLDSTLERSVDVGEFQLQDNKTSSFVPNSRSFDFTPNGGHSKSDRMLPSTSMDSSSSIHERSTENLVPGVNGSTVHGSVNPIYSGDDTEATASVSSDPPPYSDGVPNNL